jgi:hypothetical protein
MGRGRQKAKQAKVARALKYDTGSIDINALQAELASTKPSANDDLPEDGDYSAWIDDEEDDEDEEN